MPNLLVYTYKTCIERLNAVEMYVLSLLLKNLVAFTVPVV